MIAFTLDIQNNIEERLIRHTGRSLSTKAKRPWELIFQKEFSSRGEAMLFEKKLKSCVPIESGRSQVRPDSYRDATPT